MLARWETDPQAGGLSEDGLKYALEELQLTNNCLSVFLVDDDKSNLHRIVAALSATSQSPSDVEFFLLDEKELDALSVHKEKTQANTADDVVNQAHRDLVITSKDKLIHLAHTFKSKGETGRILKKKVRRMIKQGIDSGEIDCNEVNISKDSSFWKLFKEKE